MSAGGAADERLAAAAAERAGVVSAAAGRSRGRSARRLLPRDGVVGGRGRRGQ